MLLKKRNIESQLLLNRDTNQMKRKTLIRGGFMKARRSRRMRLKSKRGPDKRHKTPPPVMADDDDISQFEPTHSLLLSSLRYWEVERDLIEERIAAMAR
jgi:hypothetical protein